MAFRRIKLHVLLVLSLLFPGWTCAATEGPANDRIQPYKENPRYWQYKGKPVVLIGGSKDHNLFQIPDLEAHLKLLASVGGNYIRNTMSGREKGNVHAFARLPDGRYDLERWNEEYWRRFDDLLRLTRELDIIVQIEVWDRFDYTGDQWEGQPFNPKNNINYTYEQSGFVASYPQHPGENQQPFFFATPFQRDHRVVFRYQRRFVDEMLRRSLHYPNVLYCIDNETSADETWGAYWAEHIHQRAREARVHAYVTQMWDDWNLQSAQHRRTLDHPERYDFVEISQNNHQRGESHWKNFQWVHKYISAKPRPINTVKTYGGERGDAASRPWWKMLKEEELTEDRPGDYGTTQHGTERWWRHLIGGAAAVRFHRPPSGIGLNADAQKHIRSARLFLKEFDMVRATPDAAHQHLRDRSPNEAYLTRIGTEAYAVYFPNGGDVQLAVPADQELTLKWLEISASRWTPETKVRGRSIRLKAPGDGQWVALAVSKRRTR